MYNIATPVSSLFSSFKNYESIISHSDCLELRDSFKTKKSKFDKLYHFEFQPIHHLSNQNFDLIEKITTENKYLELISFHMASCFDKPKILNGKFVSGGKSYTLEEMFSNARKNFSVIKEIVGDSIEIAVENNNYYKTPAYKYVTEPTFINKIIFENNIFLLYDLSHGNITAYNQGIDYNKYFNSLPINKIIQLHICRNGVKNNEAYDAHFIPNKKVLDEVRYILKKADNLKYLTLEYYKNVKKLIEGLIKLRETIENYE